MLDQVENGTLGLEPDYTKKSPPFYMRHEGTNMLVVPKEQVSVPKSNTLIKVWYPTHPYPDYALWQYVPMKQPFAGYGYIEHITSRYAIVPNGGSPDPAEGNQLVIVSARLASGLFTFS